MARKKTENPEEQLLDKAEKTVKKVSRSTPAKTTSKVNSKKITVKSISKASNESPVEDNVKPIQNKNTDSTIKKQFTKRPIQKTQNTTRFVAAKETTSLDESAQSANLPEESANGKDTVATSTSIHELDKKSLADLREIASKLGLHQSIELPKRDLILNILAEQTKKGGNIFAEGVLEIIKDSHGVLRSLTMLPGENDVYVSNSQIRRFNLRQGDYIYGQARSPKEGERYLGLLKIEAINDDSPEKAISRPSFNSLTPIFPEEQIKLETDQLTLSTRIIDLISPIGKGQRGMIVAPPKVGKTTMLKDIAHGIATNHPEIHLMVLLVGERPEEVTDLVRFVKGEVIAANFDEHPENHTKISEMAVERAKRLVEQGKDVVILMDSITRLARAYNITAPPSGRTLSGGFDPVAIFPPKKFFGAARNMENGGSLTIIATALVDTGSKMDDVIFEEFKGTGNMEVKLDRKLAERRFYPSIDVSGSYTRNEDKLLAPEVLAQTWRVIRMLDTIKKETNESPTEILLSRLKKTKNNEEFLATLHESF